MVEHIVTAVANGILDIRLNRPDKKNALTVAMYAALADALERADADAAVRVVTLTGSADSFTSGNDIVDFMQQKPTPGETPVMRFLRAISTAQKPLIAAVNGLAVGVGVTMLLHCDLVHAADSATFRLPFVDLGLVPEAPRRCCCRASSVTGGPRSFFGSARPSTRRPQETSGW